MKPNHLARQLVAALALSTSASLAAAQQCPIVIDIDPAIFQNSSKVLGSNFTGTPQHHKPLAKFNGLWYFSATNEANGGRELYTTDGTALGTSLFMDINPSGDSDIHSMGVAGGLLFFVADDGVHGHELWKSDGTPAGTVLVKDLIPGVGEPNIQRVTPMGAQIVFMADTPGVGYELWISDGTSAGTSLLADLNPGPNSGWPAFMTYDPSTATLYFHADDGSHGYELWRSDGTPGGTVMVKDINPGTASSVPSDLIVWNGLVYFSATTPGSGKELWSSNGQAFRTTLVKDIRPGSLGSDLKLDNAEVFNGKLHFSANDGTTGVELWETNGKAAGTQLVADLNPAGSSAPAGMISIGTHLLFHAKGSPSVGRELMSLDTNGTVQLIQDIAPGAADGIVDYKFAATAVGGQLAFVAQPANESAQLWITDGTPQGTQHVNTSSPSLSLDAKQWLTPVSANSILFTGGKSGSQELWISDLTTVGTNVLKQIETKAVAYSTNPLQLRSRSDNELVFETYQASSSIQGLWSWTAQQGATKGASFLTPSIEYDLAYVYRTWLNGQDMTFFRDTQFPNQNKLFVSTGSPPTVSQVAGLTGSFVHSFTRLGDRVLYLAKIGADEYGQGGKHVLFETDGTETGTNLIREFDFKSLVSVGAGQVLFRSGDKLYFVAIVADPLNPPLDMAQLWSTDGTLAGTAPVPGSNLEGFSYYKTQVMVDFKDRLHFALLNPLGIELWSTDGTPGGSQPILQTGLTGFSESEGLHDPVELNNRLLFVVDEPSTRHELYATDGTAAGTQMIASFESGLATERIQLLASTGSSAYFAVNRANSAPEIWSTDGTALGTTFVAVVPNGVPGSPITDAIQVGGGVYFAAETLADGNEVWFCDGTQAGTQMLCDLNPGPDSSQPAEFTLVDGKLFFSAANKVYGRELFYVPAAGPYVADLGTAFESGGRLTASPPQLGSSVQVQASHVPSGNISVLVMSKPVFSPAALFTESASGAWLDPATAQIVKLAFPAEWTWTTPIPMQPGLAGLKLHLQNYTLPAGQFPAATSNALSLVLGS